MNETKPVALWNQPRVWAMVGVVAMVILAFNSGRSVNKVVAADPIIETPVVISKAAPIAKAETKAAPTPVGDGNNSTTNGNTNRADRGSNIVNGNGNTTNITTHYHYHAAPATPVPPVKIVQPKPAKTVKPDQVSKECEDHMEEHKRKIAEWEAKFARK